MSLSFPLCWIVVNYLALAWVLGVYGSARHMSITDDPFDDNVERSEQIATNQVQSSLVELGKFGSGFKSLFDSVFHNAVTNPVKFVQI